ncbi:peptidase [Flavobacteriaceae bacterium R38]|nr:peptidase [Flavobacteriaceae bacterium R38]
MKKYSIVLLFTLCIINSNNAQTRFQKDFSSLWNAIHSGFAYFDTQKTDWKHVKEIYQPIIDTTSNKQDFIMSLESIIHELYNGHISLNVNLPSSNRLIPNGTDLWVEYIDHQFIITNLKEHENAALSGIEPGMILTHYNDIPIKTAIKKVLPKSFKNYDKKVYDYAGNVIVAGTHNQKRKFTVSHNNKTLHFYPDDVKTPKSENTSLLEATVLENNIAYIKINNSLGKNNLIKVFGKAVDKLSETKAMILDLRDTPGGGNTTVARAIMGKFISYEQPYQKHLFPAEEKEYGIRRSWIEYVSPNGKIYTKPLAVLVGRWTGSMGEGIAIGFDGLKRGKIVGTKMAGLLGAINCFTLSETQIRVCLPTEKLFHINGTPREDFIPEFQTKTDKETFQTGLNLLASGKQ